MSVENTYRNLISMGTRMDMVFPLVENELADVLYHEIKFECARIEAALSIYKPETLFSRINSEAGKDFISLSEEWSTLFRNLIRLSKDSKGFFDFTLGAYTQDPLLKHWKRENPLHGTNYLEFNKDRDGIRLTSSRVVLDSGGFGKGYALDKVDEILGKYQVHNAFVSFGESSILCRGNHPLGDSWKVGIVNAVKGEGTLFTFTCKNDSVSVSGNSPNNHKKYPEGHLIQPATGETDNSLYTVAAKGRGSMRSEILSTAIAVCPEEEIPDILANFEDYEAVKIRYFDTMDPEIKYYSNKENKKHRNE